MSLELKSLVVAVTQWLHQDLDKDLDNRSQRPPREDTLANLKAAWRDRLEARLCTLPNFGAFREAVRILAMTAMYIQTNVHPESGVAILRTLDDLCAPIIVEAERLRKTAAETSSARLTGRAPDKAAPLVGSPKRRPDSLSLVEMRDFMHRA